MLSLAVRLAVQAVFGAFLVLPPVPSSVHAADIGTAEKVVGRVFGGQLSYQLTAGRSLPFRERVQTSGESATVLRFADGTSLTLGENALVVLDEFVYDPDAGTGGGTLSLVKGLLRYASGVTKRQDLSIVTPTATIGIRGTKFDMLVTPQGTELTVQEGTVEFGNAAGAVTVSAGRTVLAGTSGAPAPRSGPSREMARSVAATERLVGGTQTATKPSTEEGRASSITGASTTSTTASAAARDRRNMLILETSTGQVAIKLRQDLAPNLVPRLRDWVDRGGFNGLTFSRVVPGELVQTDSPSVRAGFSGGLPNETGGDGFRRGTVGMVHSPQARNTDGVLFVTMRTSPHLDGRFPIIGEVVDGLSALDGLPPGMPPPRPGRILRARVTTE